MFDRLCSLATYSFKTCVEPLVIHNASLTKLSRYKTLQYLILLLKRLKYLWIPKKCASACN